MSKKLLALFLIFFLVLVLFFVVGIKYSPRASQSSDLITPTLTPPAETTLSLSPNPATVTAGQFTSVKIIANTPSNSPTLMQFEIAFDPNMITNIQMQPGNYFDNPTVLLDNVNANNGRISFAIETSSQQTPNKKTGIVATITFLPLPTYLSRKTTLYFLPKTMIRVNGELDTLKAAYGTKILIIPQYLPQSASSSGVFKK